MRFTRELTVGLTLLATLAVIVFVGGFIPIIGAVVDRDLDRAGQLPPGARIRFRIAAPRAADAADSPATPAP